MGQGRVCGGQFRREAQILSIMECHLRMGGGRLKGANRTRGYLFLPKKRAAGGNRTLVSSLEG